MAQQIDRWLRTSLPTAAALKERLGAEYIAGAEEEWRTRTGRPITAEELERVLRRDPGVV